MVVHRSELVKRPEHESVETTEPETQDAPRRAKSERGVRLPPTTKEARRERRASFCNGFNGNATASRRGTSILGSGGSRALTSVAAPIVGSLDRGSFLQSSGA